MGPVAAMRYPSDTQTITLVLVSSLSIMSRKAIGTKLESRLASADDSSSAAMINVRRLTVIGCADSTVTAVTAIPQSGRTSGM